MINSNFEWKIKKNISKLKKEAKISLNLFFFMIYN